MRNRHLSRRVVLFAIGAAVASMAIGTQSASAQTLPVSAGKKTHFVGDSITALGWYSATGGIVDQVNATWPAPANAVIGATATGKAGVVSGASATVIASAQTRKSIAVTASGVSGNVVADVSSNMSTRVFAFNPDILIVELGVNDILTGTDITTFSNNVASLLSQALAWKPTLPIMWVGPTAYGEVWQVGPPVDWLSGYGNNVSFPTYIAAIRSACASVGAVFVDTRAPLLVYESTHNTPAPGASQGIATLDQIHPNPTGQVLMGNETFAAMSISP